MEPYYEADGITIYHGDALEVLPTMSDQWGAVIADPPYCSGGRQQANARNVHSKSARSEWFLTDNMGTDSYVWWMREVGRCLFAGAEVGAHFYCFTDWRQYAATVTGLETVGWSLKSCVVWSKGRGGAMGSFWRNDHELIPVFSKGPPTPLPDGSFFNVLTATKPQGGLHPTVKPTEVLQRLCQATTGLVLDPFMGSGTTLVAAKNLGRSAIGIEVEERYCEIAANRLAQGVLDLGGVA